MIADTISEKSNIVIKPQSGQQEKFLKTEADIAVYGGAAGAGKSFALLMEPLRHIGNPGFGAVIFRRTYPQITNKGGLWDDSHQLYPVCGAEPKFSSLEWIFPSGAKIKFAHMQYEQDRYDWDGAQVPLICFDQLESFTWKQFFYMLARNRSICGIDPYIRATCNPDPDHWLRNFLSWWIDDETGLPIRARSGMIRWFVMSNDIPEWGNTKKELIEKFGHKSLPKSFTFIHGSVFDNQILLQKNPQYLANLKALPVVDRKRLLEGNWNVRETAGTLFRKEWFEIINAAPVLIDEVRYWDRAAIEAKKATEKSSWTAGVKMGRDMRGVYYITDIVRFHGSPLEVEQTIRNTATQDGIKTRIGIEQDPGQAGKAEAEHYVRLLAGFNVTLNAVRETKGIRAKPLSAQAEAGNVKLVRGSWNEIFLREAENFDGTNICVSDQVDASSGAFHLLTESQKSFINLENIFTGERL